jgi:hypothetical protein
MCYYVISLKAFVKSVYYSYSPSSACVSVFHDQPKTAKAKDRVRDKTFLYIERQPKDHINQIWITLNVWYWETNVER